MKDFVYFNNYSMPLTTPEYITENTMVDQKVQHNNYTTVHRQSHEIIPLHTQEHNTNQTTAHHLRQKVYHLPHEITSITTLNHNTD